MTDWTNADPGGNERLAELEQIIEGSLCKYVEVGKALKEIRDSRLYRIQGFKNFEDYCEARWGWESRQTGYNYIAAAQVAELVQTSGLRRPSFSQAVEIATLPFERQAEVFSVVESRGRTLEELSVREIRGIVQEIKSMSSAADTESADALPLVTRRGDVWACGQHRLLCRDSTHRSAVETVLNDELAAMVFMDPPYDVKYAGKTARKLTVLNDDLGDGHYDFLLGACKNALAMTNGAIYICMSSSELHTLHRAFTDAGGHWSTYIIWTKHHFTLGRSDYQRQHESILYGWREGADHYWCGDRDQSDVWFVKRPAANRDHPTTKPVELVERAIRNSSRPGDIVLDLFGGAGTTMIACENLTRRARLIEIDPRYCDVAVVRWQKFAGQEAVFDGDGRTFDQIAQERRQEAA